jgi:rhodanese-related sulfurtransferase
MKAITFLSLMAVWSLALPAVAQASGTLPLAEKAAVKNVGVEEFEKLRADKNTVVLDVRTPKEFAAGHMPGATNIDWNAPDFAQKVSALDKNKVYLVHCAAGRRSASAAAKMSTMDFPKLYNLEGGFNAWQKAGKPTEK